MTKILKQTTSGGISFLELLLDETLCSGSILVEKELAIAAGGINPYLNAKQKYELLLRIAANGNLIFLPEEKDPALPYLTLEDDVSNENGWQTDCYLVGKYSAELQQNNLFDIVLQSLLDEADHEGRKEQTLSFLEQMISHNDSYWKIAEGDCPILIYKGDDICHNVLNVFAEQFGTALADAGRNVIYFDCGKEDLGRLTSYMYQHFQAIIGIQSYLFSVKMKDEVHYLHEYLYGPKYNFIFDHPIWMKQHLMHHYPDFYVLTHDENYVAFLQKYLKKEAILFPPAGLIPPHHQTNSDCFQTMYDVTFIGTYGDYMQEVLLIHQLDRSKRFLANRFLLKMRRHPELTSEAALLAVLQDKGMVLSDEAFVSLFYELRRVIYCVMHYYRYHILETLLKSGITLDVFGETWQHCPLCRYQNLICHPDVTVKESLSIWQYSKISLNIMSWHKGGFTERMANIMLCGSVLATDATTYLQRDYTKEDMIVFSLDAPETLSEQIQALLQNEPLRQSIAANGKAKTLKLHTWKKRAEEFLKLQQQITATEATSPATAQSAQ